MSEKSLSSRRGRPAAEGDLVDLAKLESAYFEIIPDADDPLQAVSFGTSGHRGSSLNGSFNEAHIAAMSLAIAEYRSAKGFSGPLFIGADTHALSGPALRTALEVLIGAGVNVRASLGFEVVPTPALSHAILSHNSKNGPDLADGIIITPSHNPPSEGGFKYNPPHGGPADTDATSWIARRANELLASGTEIPRASEAEVARCEKYDFKTPYVSELATIIDFGAIKRADKKVAVHPLAGAAHPYWSEINRVWGLGWDILGPERDEQWSFMTLDWDEKIRMDPSSADVMAVLDGSKSGYDLLLANDADADRFGIIDPEAGLIPPNHVLAVTIDYLLEKNAESARSPLTVGKTLVSSAIIDAVVEARGARLYEVPVGFKWFVPGLSSGELLFGGEESAGASFLAAGGVPWSTDKDGILMCLAAAEIEAVKNASIAGLYEKLAGTHGNPAYTRVDAPATPAQKSALANLRPEDVTTQTLAGHPILRVLTEAPGNGSAIGGLKIVTDAAWCAIRPSGTEDVMKVYAESFVDPEHLKLVIEEARQIALQATAK